MELKKFEIFRGKRIFITGHSGFKGSWLTSWLEMLGAEVFGYSDFNSNFEHYNLISNSDSVDKFDIRDLPSLKGQIEKVNPDLIFHLAAQALVSVGYESPAYTWDVNLNGTINILKCLDPTSNLRGVVIVTSDKVYLDDGKATPHLETDALGGHDPYSASKAAVEMLVESYLNSNKPSFRTYLPVLITARAGNVIGGGDFSRNRLFPDIYNSIRDDKPLLVRMPNAIRPWQHVLDCLYGYMELGAKILGDAPEAFQSYNFGPDIGQALTVREIVDLAQKEFNLKFEISPEDSSSRFHERLALQVDSTRALKDFGWQPRLSQIEAVAWTLEWYDKYSTDKIVCTTSQIERYSKLMVK